MPGLDLRPEEHAHGRVRAWERGQDGCVEGCEEFAGELGEGLGKVWERGEMVVQGRRSRDLERGVY